jgi:hypothetical protein
MIAPRAAPPPPLAAEPGRRVERFVIRRRPGEPGPIEMRDFEIIEGPDVIVPGGPRRLIVRRGPEPYPGEFEMEEEFHDDEADHAEGGYHPGPPPRPPYPPAGYGSGGMIVETITTTTTYPPATQRRRRR